MDTYTDLALAILVKTSDKLTSQQMFLTMTDTWENQLSVCTEQKHIRKMYYQSVAPVDSQECPLPMPQFYIQLVFLEVLFHLHTHTKTSFSNYFEQKKYNLKPNLHFSQFNANHFLSDDTLSTAHEIIKKQNWKVAKLKNCPLPPWLPKLSKQQISCSQIWLIDQLYIKLGSMPLT